MREIQIVDRSEIWAQTLKEGVKILVSENSRDKR